MPETENQDEMNDELTAKLIHFHVSFIIASTRRFIFTCTDLSTKIP